MLFRRITKRDAGYFEFINIILNVNRSLYQINIELFTARGFNLRILILHFARGVKFLRKT